MSIVLFPCLTCETLAIGLGEREAGVVRKLLEVIMGKELNLERLAVSIRDLIHLWPLMPQRV